MDKLKMQSHDVIGSNTQKIAQLFPNCVTERLGKDGKPELAIDFEKLQAELSNEIIAEGEERYQFTWPDKRAASRLANTPTTMTLRPCREESVDFDNTENLYIEGDNLDVLKVLRETYLGKVKMIYIDPPYNTGNDFVYNDDFAQSKEDFEQASGLFDEDGNQTIDPMQRNTESNGRFHTDWLNMIYPRLKVARDLLSDDGVIFISIDDNEVDNMRKICDDVFGNSNFIANFIKPLSGGKSPHFVKRCHEYLLCYLKNKEYFTSTLRNRSEILQNSTTRSLRKDGDADRRQDRPDMYYCIYADISTNKLSLEYFDNSTSIYPVRPDGTDGRWRWGKEKFKSENSRLTIKSKRDGSIDIHVVSEEGSVREYPWESIIKENTGSGGVSLNNLLENNLIFSYPKNVDYISWILSTHVDENALILDFFSGSATTAHAVMKLNAEDGGNRKFIMVQVPEKTDEKSEACKAGYKNICEIGKERIRRAGKKIKEEAGLQAQNLDTGFRVLKLDSSNMEDVYYTPQDFDLQTFFNENVKADRSNEDLLFQVMLDLGIKLSAKIGTKQIAGKTVHFVDDTYLVACFDKDVNESTITEIAKLQPIYFVMRDASASNDNVIDNFEQIFKHYSPDTNCRIL